MAPGFGPALLVSSVPTSDFPIRAFSRPASFISLTSRRDASFLSTAGPAGGHTNPSHSSENPVVHPTT